MQAEQEADIGCRSSCTDSSFIIDSKVGEQPRRVKHVDPRCSMHRWECGGYPYFKVHPSAPPLLPPPPSNRAMLPPCFPFLGTSGERPGQTPAAPIALDASCGGRRGSCCGSGEHTYLLQTEQYSSEPLDPGYGFHHRHGQSELTAEWDVGIPSGSSMTECHSCALQLVSHHHHRHHHQQQHLARHSARNHPHLLDVGGTFGTSLPLRIGADVGRVCPGGRESMERVDPTASAPVQCLPETARSQLGGSQSQFSGGDGRTATCVPTSSLSSFESQSAPEPVQSPAGNCEANRPHDVSPQEQKQGAPENDVVKIPADGETRTHPLVEKLAHRQTQSPAGRPSEMKASQRGHCSKVTPLYGLPSWWGDEPHLQLRGNAPNTSLVATPPSSTVTAQGFSRIQPEAVESASFDESRSSAANFIACRALDKNTDSKSPRPPTEIPAVVAQRQTVVTSRAADTAQNLGRLVALGMKEPDQLVPSSFNDAIPAAFGLVGSVASGFLGVSGPSTIDENFLNPGRHSPPERDSPRLPNSSQKPTEQKWAQLLEGAVFEDGESQKCRSPTAFIVDLEGASAALNSPKITVRTSLSEFLPLRRQQSLQRRLSSMKQSHKKKDEKEEYDETTSENLTATHSLAVSQRCFSAADARERFKSSQSCRSSFDDIIADDVSETGTYTIDVSSDSEMKAVADARDSIFAAFGITDSSELSNGKTTGKLGTTRPGYHLESLMSMNSLSDDTENGNTDPVTPTAGTSGWSFDQVHNNFELVPTVSKTILQNAVQQSTSPLKPNPLLPNSDLSPQRDIVLTVYTESASGSIMSGDASKLNSIRDAVWQDTDVFQNSASSLCSLDTSVLLAETDRSQNCVMECDTWKSQIQVPDKYLTFTKKKRYTDSLDHSLLEGNDGKFTVQGRTTAANSLTPDSSRTPLETKLECFKLPTSFSPDDEVDVTRSSDYNTNGLRRAISKRPDVAHESTEISPRSVASLDTAVLLQDPEGDWETNRMPFGQRDVYGSDSGSLEIRSDFDEDGSSVDPLGDLVSARTFASLATEVLLKPTEEVIQVLGKSTAKKTQSHSKETNSRLHSTVLEHIRPNDTGQRPPGTRAAIEEVKSTTQDFGKISEGNAISVEKPKPKKPPKAKPPTPKSCLKSVDPPKSLLSSRRCFSDLDVADHCETESVKTPTSTTEERGVNGKTTGSSVEQTRMNRTFALRCARLDSSDSSDTPRSEQVSAAQQRLARLAKKGSNYKSDEVQRSRSASRSRPTKTSARSSLDTSRSTETVGSLGQRIVRKSQDNEKKSRPTTENISLRTVTRDDDSSSFSSHKSAPPFRPPHATRSVKKKTTSERLQEDINDAADGLSVKGSHVQSRLASSSAGVQESAENEWTRRKKYNPRQSIQGELFVKRPGRAESRSIIKGNVASEDSSTKQRRRTADPSARTGAPPTSSDWTDDEKMLSPRASRDMPAVCQLSAKVKLLSNQVFQTLRKRPEFKVNEMLLRSPTPQTATSIENSIENSPPELLYIIHNLQAAERQMSAIFKVLSTQT